MAEYGVMCIVSKDNSSQTIKVKDKIIKEAKDIEDATQRAVELFEKQGYSVLQVVSVTEY